MIPEGLCQCGCGGATELAPNTSKRNGWVKGQPLKFIRFHHAKVQFSDAPSAYERIMSRIVKPEGDGCWDAGPDTGRDWYGQVSHEGKNLKCHQVVWEHHNGPVPDGKVIRHKCDNMRCARPDHLELGTVADNVQDAVKRGRVSKGVSRYNAKLDDLAIQEIRYSTEQGKVLARKYGVSPSSISMVRSGNSWKHVV